MQIVVVYFAGAFVLLYVLYCAFKHGHRTRLMPSGEPLCSQARPVYVD